jgi:hypothetical protein
MQLIDAVEALGFGRSELAVLKSESESLSEFESLSSLEPDMVGDAACS